MDILSNLAVVSQLFGSLYLFVITHFFCGQQFGLMVQVVDVKSIYVKKMKWKKQENTYMYTVKDRKYSITQNKT